MTFLSSLHVKRSPHYAKCRLLQRFAKFYCQRPKSSVTSSMFTFFSSSWLCHLILIHSTISHFLSINSGENALCPPMTSLYCIPSIQLSFKQNSFYQFTFHLPKHSFITFYLKLTVCDMCKILTLGLRGHPFITSTQKSDF